MRSPGSGKVQHESYSNLARVVLPVQTFTGTVDRRLKISAVPSLVIISLKTHTHTHKRSYRYGAVRAERQRTGTTVRFTFTVPGNIPTCTPGTVRSIR